MSSLSWVLLIGVFVFLHLFMHRGHGGHGGHGSHDGSARDDRRDPSEGKGVDADLSTDEPRRTSAPASDASTAPETSHRGHRGC